MTAICSKKCCQSYPYAATPLRGLGKCSIMTNSFYFSQREIKLNKVTTNLGDNMNRIRWLVLPSYIWRIAGLSSTFCCLCIRCPRGKAYDWRSPSATTSRKSFPAQETQDILWWFQSHWEETSSTQMSVLDLTRVERAQLNRTFERGRCPTWSTDGIPISQRWASRKLAGGECH